MRDAPGRSLARDAAELPADLLDGRLAPSPEPEDAASAARITRIAQLADRGDHPSAAREAADLLESQIFDIRLIGFYLFGVFLDHGITYLPKLLDRVGALMTSDLAVLRPTRRKLQVVNGATARLFENIAAQLQFHIKQRDATWDAWRAASDGALIEAIAAGCPKVTLALEAVIEEPLAAAPLARIRRWATDDLRRALGRREAPTERAPAATSTAAAAPPAPAPAPEPKPTAPAGPAANPIEARSAAPSAPSAPSPPSPPSAPPDEPEPPEPPDMLAAPEPPEAPPDEPVDDVLDDLPDAWPDAAAAGSPAFPDPAGTPDAPVVVGSPALAMLQAKLRGFQSLVARGELAKAAVVASDIRSTLDNFDPVAFFPSMFAAYFKTLHQIIEELTPFFADAENPGWHALDSYYRADMRAFFDD